jgi:hypothetical protein
VKIEAENGRGIHTGDRNEVPRAIPQLQILPGKTVWPQANCITSLGLSLLTWKLGLLGICLGDNELIHIEYTEQGLSHTEPSIRITHLFLLL